MRRIKQYYVSTGMVNGFSIDVEIMGQSRDGERVIVKPVAGSGSFEISKHQLKDSFRND